LTLGMLLKSQFVHVFGERNPYHIPRLIRTHHPQVVLLDMNFRKGATDGEEGIDWLKKIKDSNPETEVVMITAHGDVEIAVQALKQGATDFIEKPWHNEKLLATVRAAAQLSLSNQKLENLQHKQEALRAHFDQLAGELLGESSVMQQVFRTIDKVAKTEANILILGENGTGKEIVARSIHRKSVRSDQVFVNVDPGALPESLFESELFGHVKGAFTDAREDRMGRFEAASGGTLFLDEIGNLPPGLQSKLLQVIQNKEIIRVGSNKSIPVDIRLICATNTPLYDMVKTGAFRQDLLYRINTVEITIPPLSEREGDISLLSHYFLDQYTRKYKKQKKNISESAMHKLELHEWPGNVRELRHAIERAVILSERDEIHPDDFLLQREETRSDTTDIHSLNLKETERHNIRKALRLHHGNISKAAAELGITRAALYRRMEKFNM